MPDIRFNASFALDGRGDATRTSVFTEAYDVDEVELRTVELAAGIEDQEIALGILDHVRYLALRSDVLVGVKTGGTSSSSWVGQWWSAVEMEASTLHLTNLGLLIGQGVATTGDATSLTDSEQSWIYTTVEGSPRAEDRLRGQGIAFVLEVDGLVGYIEVDLDENTTGTTAAAALQSAIDESEGIGPDNVAVAWVSRGDNTGYLRLRARSTGPSTLLIRPYRRDLRSLAVLGLQVQTTTPGDEDLKGMTVRVVGGPGAGQSRTITAATASTITAPFDPAVGPASRYRLLKPMQGTVELLMAT